MHNTLPACVSACDIIHVPLGVEVALWRESDVTWIIGRQFIPGRSSPGSSYTEPRP